ARAFEPVRLYSTPSKNSPSAPPVVPATASALLAVERYEVGNNSALYAFRIMPAAVSKNTSNIQAGTIDQPGAVYIQIVRIGDRNRNAAPITRRPYRSLSRPATIEPIIPNAPPNINKDETLPGDQ